VYNIAMKYKHFFFDMDKTITPARQPIENNMFELLNSLPGDVIIVSGQLLEYIEKQTNQIPAFYMGANGNHANDVSNTLLWKNDSLHEEYKNEIHNHIANMCEHLEHELNEAWNPIEDRGSQITFSPVGNTAPVDVKKAYDPDAKKRLMLLEKVPFESEDIVVKIGGSTSFDYFHKDMHKGANVARLIEEMGWNKDECIYYGDGLYPGGNDEVVIGVIETVPVEDERDTFRKLSEIL